MWKELLVPGSIGSENGEILADEEYKGACRITLEKCTRCYAITCGIYGGMVHTAFADADHYQETYDDMKRELEEFLEKETTAEEELAFYDAFTTRY